MPKDIGISEFVKSIKFNSSKWYHEKYDPSFAWQKGYAIFSVSKSVLPTIKEYIRNQESHHIKQTSEEEYERFLNKHDFTYWIFRSN